ncbi:MAG: hypothetical protein M1829_003698 [Trizodia sp. TS-e1964]|nr:MAG: hypothetical protein M1829_003698 [Trizodia sp. TS-e1964]
MAAQNPSKASQAMESRDFPLAIELYSSAIAHSPFSPVYHIQRSTAYQRSSPPNYEAALRDAEMAVVLSYRRDRREHINSSQMRRGIALWGLGRYGDAEKAFGWVSQPSSSLQIWKLKVQKERDKMTAGDPAWEVTVIEKPDIKLPEPAPSKAAEKEADGMPAPTNPLAPKVPTATSIDKVRDEWYQTSDTIVYGLLVKGVSKDDAKVTIEKEKFTIEFTTSLGESYKRTTHLFGTINPETSSWLLRPTKFELSLKKQPPAQKWSSFESHTPNLPSTSTPPAISTLPTRNPPPTTTGPSYPTSSRTGPKNWDKLATDLTARAGNSSGGDSKAAGDEEFEDEGDPVNSFFKKLYQGADADTRRAMMKSYQESNGTALSTNWAEVAKAKVETTPPEGMEAKAWAEN